MLTRNYYLALLVANVYGSNFTNNTELRFRHVNGVTVNFNTNANYELSLLPAYVRSAVTSNGLIFGSNNAEATIDDYTISPLSFTATSGGITQNIDTQNKKIYVTRRYVINNASNVEKTINEFGVIGVLSSYQSLIFRNTVEPFTIAPNETVNFDLTLEYDFPIDMTFM